MNGSKIDQPCFEELLQSAEEHLDEDRPAEALGLYSSLLEHSPNHQEALLSLAALLRDAGRLDGSLEVAQRAIEAHPEQSRGWFELGRTHEDSGRTEQALEAYEQTLELNPQYLQSLLAMGRIFAQAGRSDQARLFLERALDLHPETLEGRLALGNLHRNMVPSWHFRMLNDAQRTLAFRQAIESLVGPDDLVLDIGTGTGLLAMMAARAGAQTVIACEAVHPLANLAETIVEKNGYADRVRVFPLHSTLLQVGLHLPRRADVVLAEIVDATLIGEGILPVLRHARRYLLTPEARFIPRSGILMAMLIESEPLLVEHRVEQVDGFDVSPLNRFAYPGMVAKRLARFEHEPLSEPFEVFDFDFSRPCALSGDRRIEVPIMRDGLCHGVALWFRLHLNHELVIENDPTNEESVWQQAIKTLDPLRVSAGQRLEVRARHDESVVWFDLQS